MPSRNKAVPISSPGLHPIDPSDLLTPDELAARLKVRPTWVYEKLRQRGPIPLPHFKMGRYLRFSWAAVSTWLQAQQRGAVRP